MSDQLPDPPDWGNIPPVLTALDVAVIFNVDYSTVLRWVKNYQLRSYRWFGQFHIFPREYILEFVSPPQVERLSQQAREKWDIPDEQIKTMQANRRESAAFYERFGMKP